jgi:hypothetical protein
MPKHEKGQTLAFVKKNYEASVVKPTLGAAAAARVRPIVRCKASGHRVEPDPAEMAERYGAGDRCSIDVSGWSVPCAATGR